MGISLYLDEADCRSAWQQACDYTDRYAREILAHAGLPHTVVERRELSELPPGPGDILILGRWARLAETERRTVTAFVDSGGTLLAVGGTAGLDDLFGVRPASSECIDPNRRRPSRCAEGYLLETQPDHELGALFQSGPLSRPLHVFDVAAYEPAGATVIAGWARDPESPPGPGVCVRVVGRGRAVLVSFDLPGSVLHIQQGRPVHVDGPAAPDDTVPVDDRILKTDDGVVLDYRWDRGSAENAPLFDAAVADRLRELFLQILFWATAHAEPKKRLAMLWYWPGRLDAIGHVSHDTDGNVPELGEALFSEMQALGIPSTWCLIYPGGYAPAFYKRLRDAGFEVALHYDALSGQGRNAWSLANLERQRDWLLDMSGLPALVSNKNHYTRWEGRTEFFRWLEQAGIAADQTRGPSKRGNVGFLHGSCHPWFPMDDWTRQNRLIDVLEVPLHSQDLIVTCPYAFGPVIIDEAAARHGIAHLLFHPAHIRKPGIAEALRGAVEYGRSKGLEWWTCERINAWERWRRTARLERVGEGENDSERTGGWSLSGPPGAEKPTLLVGPIDSNEELAITLNGVQTPAQPFSYLGFTFARATVAGTPGV